MEMPKMAFYLRSTFNRFLRFSGVQSYFQAFFFFIFLNAGLLLPKSFGGGKSKRTADPIISPLGSGLINVAGKPDKCPPPPPPPANGPPSIYFLFD
jgi:hypothetical protein